MSEGAPMLDGAYLSMGEHCIGRFDAKCAECDQRGGHWFKGATFNPDGWYLCNGHAAMYFLREAWVCDEARVRRWVRETIGTGQP